MKLLSTVVRMLDKGSNSDELLHATVLHLNNLDWTSQKPNIKLMMKKVDLKENPMKLKS